MRHFVEAELDSGLVDCGHFVEAELDSDSRVAAISSSRNSIPAVG
jgi:hypothetical protein